jgi:hypothetical protein
MTPEEERAAESCTPWGMEEAAFEQISRAAKAWVAKWPNHCVKCAGWGGFHIRATRWEPEDFDICTALPDGSCHRCGQPDAQGVDPDAGIYLPCKFCGWDFDDGAPQV